MKCVAALLMLVCSLWSQSYRVELPELTTEDGSHVHITRLSKNAPADIALPAIPLNNAQFFTLFYTWDFPENPSIDVMVFMGAQQDTLYIDLNNDRDLTNDGAPFYFPADQDDYFIDVVAPSDPKQLTRLLLSRKPGVADSLLSKYLDDDGNMCKECAKIYGLMSGNPEFKGEKGSFYFDDRVTIRRGNFHSPQGDMLIALFDYTNNGRFDDEKDVLLADTNNDGQIEYDMQGSDVYKLNDIFTIYEKNYEITSIDKYGTWLELQETDKEPTFYFLQEIQQELANHKGFNTSAFDLDSTFWDLRFETMNGNAFAMQDLKGQNVLLNFWGEWCGPCCAEIPDLLSIDSMAIEKNVQLVSFVNTSRPEAVQKIVQEKQIQWPQILMPEDIQQKFNIIGYPTNILILPDGKSCIRSGMINKNFIHQFAQ